MLAILQIEHDLFFGVVTEIKKFGVNPIDFPAFRPYYFPAMKNQPKGLPDIFARQFPKGRFILQKDNAGAIVVRRPLEPERQAIVTSRNDQWLVYGILSDKETIKLDSGSSVEVWGEEMRAIVFEEFWLDSRPVEPSPVTNLMFALL
jgi:hypothetical protein